MRIRVSCLTILMTSTMLVACNLAPDYHVPEVSVPAAFKEAPLADDAPITDGNWAAANPEMAKQFGRDAWWEIFNDATLNQLILKANKQSPTLKAARQRLLQARAFTQADEARLYPTITADSSVIRQKFSAANPNFPPGVPIKPFTLYSASLGISYGLDVFGRARNVATAAQSREEGAEQLYRAARITLAGDIAESYYRLCGLRAEEALLIRTQELRQQTLTRTRSRYEIGDVSDKELAQMETAASAANADVLAMQQQVAVVEHALAILTGEPPSGFSVETPETLTAPPQIPAGLPATLLERRPDIAQAEREMAATNAEIGFARGAFFPAVNLGASGGYQSSTSDQLLDWSSRTWLLGPATGTLLSLPVFDGGRNSANLAAAKASYRAAVANYRAQILIAFKETEDALSGVRSSAGQAAAQDEAHAAATRADRIAGLQYENGIISSFERMDAERSLLEVQRALLRARADQFVSTITLIRALGGGWDTTSVEEPLEESPETAPANGSDPAPESATPLSLG